MEVKVRPFATATGARPLALVPAPTWPYVPFPQQYAAPDVARPHEWYAPASTVAKVTTPTPTVAVPRLASAVAVIVAVPGATPDTTPDESTVAIPGASLLQVTVGSTRRVPVESVKTARRRAVPPATIAGAGG